MVMPMAPFCVMMEFSVVPAARLSSRKIEPLPVTSAVMMAAVVCRLSAEPSAPPMPAPAFSVTELPMMRVDSSRSSTMVLPVLL
ncbi:hypothetical protein D3C71_1780480 [compost metagenome]